MPKLSVIILSYNTSEITKRCLDELIGSLKKTSFESQIILVDNASTDGSPEMIATYTANFSSKKIQIVSIFNDHNQGYPKGNNLGLKKAKGEFVLFLNSDVMVGDINWERIITEISKDEQIGALTIRLNLPSGEIDPASHRGFPTVWNSICYYLGFEKLARNMPFIGKYFGGYHLVFQDLEKPHEIDSPSGAFFLTRKTILQNLGGFDEEYFMYGEDLDLAYKLKENNFKVIYFPYEKVIHLKYSSGFKDESRKAATKKYFYDAMKIFYKKHYESKNPWVINRIIYLFIDLRAKL